MSGISKDEEQHWNNRWQEESTPWDLEGPTPALVNILSSHKDIIFPTSVAHFKILVPGCGRGYDLVHFAKFPGTFSVGLDISEIALGEAVRYRDSQGISSDKIVYKSSDFLVLNETGTFDVFYDHTFLCALHPRHRDTWSSQVHKLLKKGGRLITIMFPLRENDEYGPPFALSVEEYRRLLPGFECIMMRDFTEDERIPGRERSGKEMVALWEKK